MPKMPPRCFKFLCSLTLSISSLCYRAITHPPGRHSGNPELYGRKCDVMMIYPHINSRRGSSRPTGDIPIEMFVLVLVAQAPCPLDSKGLCGTYARRSSSHSRVVPLTTYSFRSCFNGRDVSSYCARPIHIDSVTTASSAKFK
ncbi:hypothetical protein F5Y10DRAFT_32268 [Nemania abortiva]|nr:hypothetical protein F5Y10DRAFT_32268 [Nemania abortiva]